jgi:hypothetical protein
MTEDLVWLQNDKIKIGINLLRGGQIAWASLINSTTNLVYNGYDGGLQISCDIYQAPNGYTQNGKISRFQDNPNATIASYNTTMGGDFNNNSQSLISYGPITNGYKVKFRPIFYTFDCEWAEVTIEAKYTLEPGSYAVKCEYIYKSFRTDGQYNHNTFDSSAIPACFLVNTLRKYQVYTGNSPWTNDTPEEGNVPINNDNGRYFGSLAEPVKGAQATERYSCVYNPDNGITIGAYMPTSRESEYTKIKQLEVYSGNPPGNEFEGGFTYLDFAQDLTDNVVTTPIPDRSNFTKELKTYLIIAPSTQEFRAEVYRKRAQQIT